MARIVDLQSPGLLLPFCSAIKNVLLTRPESHLELFPASGGHVTEARSQGPPGGNSRYPVPDTQWNPRLSNKTQSCEILGGRLASLRFLFLDMDQKLSELVEELTTSGEPQLNPEKMKQLKKVCKYVLWFCLSKSVPTLENVGLPWGQLPSWEELAKEHPQDISPRTSPQGLQCSVLFWGSSSRQGCAALGRTGLFSSLCDA